MRRGLTMIELLLALALLSGLAVASLGWVQLTARAGAEITAPNAWSTAAEMMLELVGDDLICEGRGDEERVQVSRNSLAIRTRSARTGASRHVYRFDESTGTLSRQHISDSQKDTRVLLTGVSAFGLSLDEENSLLTVAIEGNVDTRSRRYRLP